MLKAFVHVIFLNAPMDPLLKTLSDQDKTRLTAKYEGPSPDGADVYTLDIIMAGDNETPFFDDFLS